MLTKETEETKSFYEYGDKLKIIKGKYILFRHGVFVSTYGTKMAKIKVNGLRNEKQVLLSSIELMKPMKAESTASSPTEADPDDTKGTDEHMYIKRSDYDALQQEVSGMRDVMQEMMVAISKLEMKLIEASGR